MPKPVSRRELIRRLRALGWEGLFPGGHDESMRYPFTGAKVPIPNPHKGDIDWSLTERILAQGGISRLDWEHATK